MLGGALKVFQVPPQRCLQWIYVRNHTQFYKQVEEINVKRRQHPQKEEVELLRKSFPKAKDLLNRFLAPVIAVDPRYEPHCECKRNLNGTTWKFQLTVIWPRRFQVCGIGARSEMAEEFAFLSACQMLHFCGVLTHDGRLMDFKKSLLECHSNCVIRVEDFQKTTLNFNSGLQALGGHVRWTSRLTISWPVALCVQGEGLTQEAAEQNAAVLAFVKFKANGMVSRDGVLKPWSYISLPRRRPQTEAPGQPADYEVYVDASNKGYGAYLVAKTGPESATAEVRWLCAPWGAGVEPYLHNSSFLEFYGLLAAVFTWKKKFVDKRVAFYTDSSSTAMIVRGGISRRHACMTKMFQVLCWTCMRYNISVHASHISRHDNLAADYLSRMEVDRFLRLVPNARRDSKKPKKLEFFAPLTMSASLQGRHSAESQPRTHRKWRTDSGPVLDKCGVEVTTENDGPPRPVHQVLDSSHSLRHDGELGDFKYRVDVEISKDNKNNDTDR